jgi:hypothetical protein
MSEADLYRQYAKEAMHGSSKIKDVNEKQALVDLAFTWAQAALMSDRVGMENPPAYVLARSPALPSITNNLDCDQSIRRHRQTAAVVQR